MTRRNNDNASLLLTAAVGAGLFLAARSAVRASRWLDLAGKHVLITGGSRGLGLLLAREFAGRGARVAICARDAAELQRARDDLSAHGADVMALQCDVSDRHEVERMGREVLGHWGGLDVLVNNAGVIQTGPMEVMTHADYEEAMNVHFWGPLHTTLAFLPSLRERGRQAGARVVNISSIGGKVAVPHLLPYTASKFALTGFSEGLRSELAKDNVLVTTICPGLMRTGSPRNAFFKGQHRAEYAWFTISDSLPLTSMDAGRAARRVVLACQRGEAEVVLSIQAKLAATFFALFPGLSVQLGGLMNQFLLPAPGGIGERRARGSESESALTRSPLTALTRRAARANNEV